jgi:signal transduction histidine kinase
MGGQDSAKYYLDKSIELAIPNSANDILHSSYGEVANYLQKIGKQDEAIRYYKKYIQLKDTLYSKQSSQMMASYKTLYDVEKKEQEIELLSKDKQLAEAQAQEQRMVFYWVVAGLIIIIALFIFYYRFSKRLRKLNVVISEKSEEIQAQSEELLEHNSLLSSLNEELVQSNSHLNETVENLHKTQTQLVQSEKMASLGVLSAGIAHELNNPLNFIKGGVNALDNELKNIDQSKNDQVAVYIEIINEGVNRASAILKGLSQYSRQSEIHNERCDIHKILDNCLVILGNKLKHRITIERNYSEDPVVLLGNEGKLHQVFINLLSNAEQAIQGNGVIRIMTKKENDQLSIFIEDTGGGISKENLSKIGDPFFTTKLPGQGTGLGLSIAYQIIESHGGKVLVTSELNQGTKFLLLFNGMKSVTS